MGGEMFRGNPLRVVLDPAVSVGNYETVIELDHAYRGQRYRVRIYGKDIAWRVATDGAAGDYLESGGVLGVSLSTVAVTLASDTVAASRLKVQLKSNGPNPACKAVEIGWVPVDGQKDPE